MSPNGQYVAFQVVEGLDSKIQVYDVSRGTTTRLTQEGSDALVAWHPNGREIAISSARQTADGIFLKALNGSERLLVTREPGTNALRPGSWSPDGKLLAYCVQKGGNYDIWIVPEDGKSAPHAFLNGPASESNPMFSPDGKWLAYVSDKSGRSEVYVRPYPDGDDIPVSAGGGAGPGWRPDGKEIFYQSDIDAVRRLVGGLCHSGRTKPTAGRDPVKVLDMRVPGTAGAMEQYAGSSRVGNGYDIFPDGQRFVMVRGADSPAREIVLVQNWFREFVGR